MFAFSPEGINYISESVMPLELHEGKFISRKERKSDAKDAKTEKDFNYWGMTPYL
jgi:hypothetical protein